MVDASYDTTGDTFTLKGGQELTMSSATGHAGVLTVNAAGTTDALGDVLTITLNGGANKSLAAGGITTDKFEDLVIKAGDNTITTLILDTGTAAGNDANILMVGTNDITFAADANGKSVVAAAENVNITGKSLTFAGDVNGNDIDLTATGGAVTATAEDIVATQNGSINISATTNVALASADADSGNAAAETVTISGNDIDVTGVIKGYDVTLTATDAKATSTLGGILTVGNDLTFADGQFDVNAAANVTGVLKITGDAKVDIAGGITTASGGVIITSTNDVDFSGNLVTPVLNAGSASGKITADFDGNTAGVVAVTGSGNDTLTLDDAVVFQVTTGDGVDNVTATVVAAGSTISTQGGKDTVLANQATGTAYTVDTGAGDDSITVAADSDAAIDGGADYDTVTMAAGNYSDDSLTLKNIEKMIISGTTTLSSAQFDNDNTFELSGAQTLTITASAADTIDASNLTFDIGAVGNLAINGSGSADVIIGSDAVDAIDAGAGNDTITTGTGADTITYGTGTDGVDTITDFATGVDSYITDFATTKGTGANKVIASSAVDTTSALALDSANKDVAQITGVTLALADASNEQAVINAISNGTVTVSAASNKILLVVVTSTNTFLYEVTETGGADGNITTADTITLVGIFENGVTFAAGDID
jgi:hypothetical protein